MFQIRSWFVRSGSIFTAVVVAASRVAASGFTAFGSAVVCLLLLSGCTGNSEQKPEPKKSKTSDAARKEECARKLSSAVARIYPESMATQARRDTVVNGLNSWLSSCGGNSETPKISEANAALLSPAVLRTASSARFTENDVIYIRDCLLLKSLTESIWKQADEASVVEAGAAKQATNRERIVLLFQYLMRNISLMSAAEQRAPLGLYEVMLTGRGTVEDRIWAFGEALRQRRLDCVLLSTSGGDALSADPVKAADVLLAVVDGDDVLLFDPVRATAVPKAGDVSLVVVDPAGLDTVSGDDRWKAAAIEVICHPSGFAPRMIAVQVQVEASDSAVLYEELAGGTSADKPVRDRLAEVFGDLFKPEMLRVWSVPEQRVAAVAAMNEAQKLEIVQMMRVFDSPFEREMLSLEDIVSDPTVNLEQLSEDQKRALWMKALEDLSLRSDKQSDVLYGTPSGRLRSTRLAQIMGNVGLEMIQSLQQIRIANLQEKLTWLQTREGQPINLPKGMVQVQRAAVSDALFWTSMCQISRKDFGAALATLRNYRSQYPDGQFVMAAIHCEVEVLIAMGDAQTAATVLATSDVDGNPQRIAAQWLLGRLAAQ